jgi:OmcA/MtrC family decaheme c-type cytochrome
MLAACGGGGGGTAATSGGASGGSGGTTASQTVTPPSGPVQDASTLAASAFAALQPSGAITSVAINSPPVIAFQVTDASGHGVKGLCATPTKTSTDAAPRCGNLGFSIAKLVPGANGSPSKWVSYVIYSSPKTTDTAVVPTRPTTENYGTLVDNGDGTYKYTFYRDITKIRDTVAALTLTAPNSAADLGDLTYDPLLLHRVTIQVSGNAPGTGSNTATGTTTTTAVPMQNPLSLVFDFYPATGKAVAATDANQREIVKVAACFECHGKFTGFHASAPVAPITSANAAARQDTRMCVMCHNDQQRYGQTAAASTSNAFPALTKASNGSYSPQTNIADGVAVADFPAFVHKIHMGENLVKTNYNFAGAVLFNETKFPQDIRNCTKCHDGTAGARNQAPQGDNWKNVPNRLACGACHDGINFATGKGLTLADARAGLTTSQFGHIGGIQTDDSKCALCHSAAAIPVYHVPVTPIAPAIVSSGVASGNTNAASVAANQSNLPAGAIKVTYDVQSVSRNASKQPVIVFRILQNGARADFNANTGAELWTNFVGSPSAYFVFAVPQDGITAPADYNVSVSSTVKTLWKGNGTGASAGTLSGPDASGYYTATLTGVTVPDNAVMLTGGIGFTYSLPTTPPLTQTNLSDYPYDATTKIGGLIVASPTAQMVATGYTARRAIVDNSLCNKCHEKLGVFTREAFHAGQRNDANTCAWCHKPNQTSSGWSADSASYIHALHAASKRTKPFTWHASTTTESFANIGFPGVLKNCETCHLPGTYDFGASASASALPNRLYRTVGAGKYDGTVAGTLAKFQISPYVTADNVTDYGAGFSYNAATSVTTPAAATTLVNSPIATACFACHDSDLAVQHMQGNGASIYEARSTALAKSEQCTLCHTAGKVADIKTMHAK